MSITQRILATFLLVALAALAISFCFHLVELSYEGEEIEHRREEPAPPPPPEPRLKPGEFAPLGRDGIWVEESDPEFHLSAFPGPEECPEGFDKAGFCVVEERDDGTLGFVGLEPEPGDVEFPVTGPLPARPTQDLGAVTRVSGGGLVGAYWSYDSDRSRAQVPASAVPEPTAAIVFGIAVLVLLLWLGGPPNLPPRRGS